jgi:hypothetical protein
MEASLRHRGPRSAHALKHALNHAVDAGGNPQSAASGHVQRQVRLHVEFADRHLEWDRRRIGDGLGSLRPPNPPSWNLSGVCAEWRACDAVPLDGVLILRGHSPIGWCAKCKLPRVFSSRVFIGTRGAGTGT